MKKKDTFLIILGFLLFAGVLTIGASGDVLRRKLGIKSQIADVGAGVLQLDSALEKIKSNGQYVTSNNKFAVFSPKPEEIIKGSSFLLEGNSEEGAGVLLIEIKDRDSGEILFSTTTDAVGSWKIGAGANPKSGWAIISATPVAETNSENSVSFPVKISPSI